VENNLKQPPHLTHLDTAGNRTASSQGIYGSRRPSKQGSYGCTNGETLDCQNKKKKMKKEEKVDFWFFGG
jgi:hypothetical protein